MSHQHGLHAVADELAGSEAVLHAHMAHGDAVADADGRDEDGGAPCHLDACLDGVGDLIQIHMAGDDLTVGTHHTDEGAVQLFRGVAQGVKQASVGRALRAFGHIVTSHSLSSLLTKECQPGSNTGAGTLVKSDSYFFSQLIMPRSSAPTFSMGCSASMRR